MSQTPLHGVIIGGGLSGLTLAQELKKAGVSVAERGVSHFAAHRSLRRGDR